VGSGRCLQLWPRVTVFFVQCLRIQPLTSLPEKHVHVQRIVCPHHRYTLTSIPVRRQLDREEAAAPHKGISLTTERDAPHSWSGWEMHHGFFLVPINSTSAKNWFLVDWDSPAPNFSDAAVADKFIQQEFPNASTPAVQPRTSAHLPLHRRAMELLYGQAISCPVSDVRVAIEPIHRMAAFQPIVDHERL